MIAISTAVVIVSMALIVTILAIAAIGYVFWRRQRFAKVSGSNSKLSEKIEAEQLKSAYLINAIADGVIVFDHSGEVQLINPAAAAMLGWRAEEAVGLDYSSVFEIIEQTDKNQPPKASKHPFKVMLATAKPVNQPAIAVKTRADNTQLIVSLGVSPILASKNKVGGGIAVFRDISREKAREKERSDFVSTASHEMRTPLAAIEGFLALAMNPKVCQIDDKARGYIQQAHSSTQHLGKLFQDLLTTTKAEDGRIANHPQPVEMGEFLDKLIDGLRFSAEKKGLSIEYIINTSRGGVRPLHYVMVDPDRMEEVIANLFDNAVKYTDKGTVSIGLTGDNKTVQIFVKDEGAGIPQEDIPHLFQKFYRAGSSATQSTSGTGLGLFICKKLIDLYNGKIWVESKPNQGTTFYINLERLNTAQVEEFKSGRTVTPTNTSG